MMRIGIVGGGISGLYLARLLKDKYDVTIFESAKWGGDIQTEHINGKCYPISTLFAMPGDTLLKQDVNRLHIKTRPLYPPLITYLIAELLVVVILVKTVHFFRKKMIILTLGISVIVVMKIMNDLCHVLKAFGLVDANCDFLHKFYGYGGDFQDVLFKPILYLENCGPYAIVQSYLNDKNIKYISEKVVKIWRKGYGCTFVLNDNRMMEFDKCIITTTYDNYKNIITLTEHEINVLSGTYYFDFYSTLVLTSNSNNVTKSIDKFKIDNGVYLFASYQPVEVKPGTYTFKKSYKWSMPRVYNATKKQKINDEVARNVFFVGKELSGNGMNHCMKYSLKLSQRLLGFCPL